MLNNSRIRFLSEETILRIIKEELDKESEITYSIKCSKSSLSIYIRLYSKTTKCFVSRRISDHEGKTDIKTLLVGSSTKYKQVQRFIQASIKQLKNIRFKQLLKSIGEQRNENGKELSTGVERTSYETTTT